MRHVSVSQSKEEADFAKEAAEYFAENQKCYSFAHGDPAPGEYIALRWNTTAVVVLKLDINHEPACYPVTELIQKYLPPVKGELEP